MALPDRGPARPQESPSFINTPEFKEAVQAAVAAQLPAVVKQVQESIVGDPATLAKASDGTVIESMMKSLALAIAGVADQGSETKRVSPEVLEFRRKERARMYELIQSAINRRDAPVYTLKNQVYLSDHVINPLVVGHSGRPEVAEIYFYFEPNEAMVPVNDVAKEIYAAYKNSLGNSAKVIEDEKFELKGLGTAHALLVKSRPQLTQSAMQEAREAKEGPFAMLGRRNGRDVETEKVRILGTVAPAAEQAAY